MATLCLVVYGTGALLVGAPVLLLGLGLYQSVTRTGSDASLLAWTTAGVLLWPVALPTLLCGLLLLVPRR